MTKQAESNKKPKFHFVDKLQNLISDLEYSKIAGIHYHLWHYTNLSAPFNIIETEELWLSDVRNMNDKNELIQSKTSLQYLLKKYKTKMNTFLLDAIPDHLKDDSSSDDELSAYSVFLMSFSRAQDLLSQWKGYAFHEGGIAIKFYTKSLWNSEDETLPPIGFFNSVYDDKDKDLLIRKFINGVNKLILQAGTLTKSDKRELAMHSDIFFHNCATSFKGNEWSEEKETRMIIDRRSAGNMITYRYSNGKIRPLIKLPIKPKNIITEIMLLDAEPLKTAMLNEYLHSKNLSNVIVTKSKLNMRFT